MISLRLKQEFTIPLEAEAIRPDALKGLSPAEIERLPVLHGNLTARLADFFSVHGEASVESEDTIRLEGNLSRVKYLGQGMTRGRMEIIGDAGMHLGAEMRGGSIVVHGDAGDWVGAEMRGGSIRVEGAAGHLVGGAYRGSEMGMRGGTILVRGGAGNEVGCAMRRGLIAVGGDVGDFAGVMMRGGSLLVFGRLAIRAGAAMKRGSIVSYERGAGLPAMLPTYQYACDYRPVWLRLLLRQLQEWGFEVPGPSIGGSYRRYAGDFTELGKGEILIWTSP